MTNFRRGLRVLREKHVDVGCVLGQKGTNVYMFFRSYIV